jgi:hypothetical protein
MQAIRETCVAKRNGWKIGLALGLSGFLLCAGCSEQDSDTSRNVASVTPKVVDSAEAIRLAALEAIELGVAERRSREGGKVVEPEALAALVERARERMESGVDDSKINIRRSGNAERDGYDKARARAKALTNRQPDAGGDR